MEGKSDGWLLGIIVGTSLGAIDSLGRALGTADGIVLGIAEGSQAVVTMIWVSKFASYSPSYSPLKTWPVFDKVASTNREDRSVMFFTYML